MRTTELGIVLAQALTALWFCRLFLEVDDTVTAGALAAFRPMRRPEQPDVAGKTGEAVTS